VFTGNRRCPGRQFDDMKAVDYAGLQGRVQSSPNQLGDSFADTDVTTLSIRFYLRQKIIIER